MYIFDCMSCYKNREEAREYLQNRYNITLDNPNDTEKNYNLINEYFASFLKKKTTEFSLEVKQFIDKSIIDSVVKVISDPGVYVKDLEILLYLSLIELLSDEYTYVSKYGIHEKAQFTKDNSKDIAKAMIITWNKNTDIEEYDFKDDVIPFNEEDSGSDAIPLFPFDITIDKCNRKKEDGSVEVIDALKFKSSELSDIYKLFLSNEKFFNLFRTTPPKEREKKRKSDLKQKSVDITHYGWYRSHLIYNEIQALSIGCKWATELCLGNSYTNSSYAIFKQHINMDFSDWNSITGELADIVFLNIRLQLLNFISDVSINYNNIQPQVLIKLCNYISCLMKSIVVSFCDIWWNLFCYSYERDSINEILHIISKFLESDWYCYEQYPDIYIGEIISEELNISPMFKYNTFEDLFPDNDGVKNKNIWFLMSIPEDKVIRKLKNKLFFYIQKKCSEIRYSNSYSLNETYSNTEEIPLFRGDDDFNKKTYTLLEEEFYRIKKESEKELADSIKDVKPKDKEIIVDGVSVVKIERNYKENHYYPILHKSVVVKCLKYISDNRKGNLNDRTKMVILNR